MVKRKTHLEKRRVKEKKKNVHMADNTENTFQDHQSGCSVSNIYIKSNYS